MLHLNNYSILLNGYNILYVLRIRIARGNKKSHKENPIYK